MPPNTLTGNEPTESRPDLTTLRRLQNVRGFPAVSILLSTSPSNRLTETDSAALERLIAQAADRLHAEAGTAADHLGARMRSLFDRASTLPADRAMALYVHANHAEIVRLPMPIHNRVVIAETFATGDVVMAFRHAPHYLLLTLGEAATRLFNGHGRWLEERNAERFRAVNPWRGASNLRAVGWAIDASVAYAGRQRTYLRRIEAALDAIEPSGDVPVVLAGDRSLCAAFLELTARPERVVGTVPCDDCTEIDAVGRLAGRLMAGRVSRLQHKALAAMESADMQGRMVSGIAEVWPAVIRGEGETLLVEESTTWPARISGDGLGLRSAAPEGDRGVVADVIGELAWAVTFYGGDVVVVSTGALKAFSGIALILRSPRTVNDLEMAGMETAGTERSSSWGG